MAINSLPPLNSLRCFDKAARCENFTEAADELFITPSAVSHHIKTLENYLGAPLFYRSGRKMLLTTMGQTYFQLISNAFDDIAEARTVVARSRTRRTLHLGVPPDFSTVLLIPNLSKFLAQNADIQLEITTSPRGARYSGFQIDNGAAAGGKTSVDLKLDCEIRYGHGKWLNFESFRLINDDLIPVCSPTLLAGSRQLSQPSDVLGFPPIFTGNRHLNWWVWADHFEIKGIEKAQALHIDRSALAISAAAAGLGIALESRLATATLLDAGKLVVALPFWAPSQEAYYFLHTPHSENEELVSRFRHWLEGTLAAYTPEPIDGHIWRGS